MALRAYGLLVLTMLLWGGNAIAGRLAVGHVSPFLLTALRWGLCSLVAVAASARHLRRERAALRRHAGILLAYGAVGFAAFNATYYTAADYTTALNIVIIQAGAPLVVFVASFAFYRIRTTRTQAAGFLLTLVGVLVVASNGSLPALLALKLNRGDALMLVALLFTGGYTAALTAKPALHWMSFMTAISVGAFLAALPLAAWEVARGSVIWPDAQGWGVVVYAAFLPGLIAQAAFIAAAEILGANRAGVFTNLVPVFGAALSLLVLGERLRPYHLAALALVLAGLALAERRPAAARAG